MGLAENLRQASGRRAACGVVGLNAAKQGAPRAAIVLSGHAGFKLSAGAAASRGHVGQGGAAFAFHAQALRLCVWGVPGAPCGAVHMWQITGECSGRRQAQCQHAKGRHSRCHALHAKGAGYKPRAHMFDQACHGSALVDDALGLAERARQAGVVGHVYRNAGHDGFVQPVFQLAGQRFVVARALSLPAFHGEGQMVE